MAHSHGQRTVLNDVNARLLQPMLSMEHTNNLNNSCLSVLPFVDGCGLLRLARFDAGVRFYRTARACCEIFSREIGWDVAQSDRGQSRRGGYNDIMLRAFLASPGHRVGQRCLKLVASLLAAKSDRCLALI